MRKFFFLAGSLHDGACKASAHVDFAWLQSEKKRIMPPCVLLLPNYQSNERTDACLNIILTL